MEVDAIPEKVKSNGSLQPIYCITNILRTASLSLRYKMFAVVSYKNMDERGVIPVSWIYNWDEKKVNTTTSYLSFYSNNIQEVAPEKYPPNVHLNDAKEKVPGNFYKIFIEKFFGK